MVYYNKNPIQQIKKGDNIMKRNNIIDILKGIGICLIVIGHTDSFTKHFIYLFHVGIFIIASGLFFKDEKIKSFKGLLEYIKKKIISLYIPYVIINILAVLLNNLFINIGIYSFTSHNYYNLLDIIYSCLKIVLFRGVTEIGGATWFLHLLFLINVTYAIISYLFSKIYDNKNIKYIFQIFISIIFLVIGYFMSINCKNEIISIYVKSMCCYYLFLYGNLFNYYKEKINFKLSFLLMPVSILLLMILNKCGSVEISKNIYTSIPFFVSCSVLGWILLYSISVIIDHYKINAIFRYIGERSIYILLFHFLSFKIVNIIICLIIKDEWTVVSSFPTAYGGKYSLLYIAFGIVIPVLISEIHNFAVIKFNKKNIIKIENELYNNDNFKIDKDVMGRIFVNKIRKIRIKRIKLKSIKKGLGNKIVFLQDTDVYKFLNNKIDENEYNEYLIMHSRNDENHSISIFNKLKHDFTDYNLKNGAIIVDNYNILIDGQHRSCLLLNKYGKEYSIKVIKIYYYGLHLKTLCKVIICYFLYLLKK